MKSSVCAFSETLSYLKSLEKSGIKLGIQKMRLFLESTGSPHLRYRSVLVAGTNGKGSTASMIAGLAKATGLKTGLYTSPHLVTILERIKVDSVNIEERKFIDIAGRLREMVEGYAPGFHLTLFEFLTAAACLYFCEEKVDIAIFEVGLGGRLDATGVVQPELSVITEIDIDHTEYLGNTLEEITLEKCGVIRENGTVLLTSEKERVVEAVKKNCTKKNAELYRFGSEYKAVTSVSREKINRMDFKNRSTGIYAIDIGLSGAHQIRNAATAIQAILLLRGESISEENIKQAISSFRLEGRAELVILDSKRFLLDIAHNPNAAASLAKTISEEFRYDSLFLIAGIMADKDVESILKILVPKAKTTILTAPDTERAASSKSLETRAERFSESVISTDCVKSAITAATALATTKDLIVITGSCCTVGEAKEYLVSRQVK